MASAMGYFRSEKELRPRPTTLYDVAAQQAASPSFHELRDTYPRPTRDPEALAKWELDVADGTLIPEFRRVHVGYYEKKIEPEEFEVATFGSSKIHKFSYNRVVYREPRYEERLVWVRNPDRLEASPTPEENPRRRKRKTTVSTGPK